MLILVSTTRGPDPTLVEVALTRDEDAAARAAYRFVWGDPEGTPEEQAATVAEYTTVLPPATRINVEGDRI